MARQTAPAVSVHPVKAPGAAAIALLLVVGGTHAGAPAAPGVSMLAEHDVRIETRDGVSLSADVYRPDDAGRHPTLLELTPYGNAADGVLDDVDRFVRRGYAFVSVDVRGRFDSDGEFVPFRNDGRDGSDVIDWIASQTWSNQRVATYGADYAATNQRLIARERNPRHVAIVSTGATFDDWRDGTRYDGVPRLEPAFNWHMQLTGRTMPSIAHGRWLDLLQTLPLAALDRRAGQSSRSWQDAMKHDRFDRHWESLSAAIGADVALPSFHVTGWYDGRLRGTLAAYASHVRATGNAADHVLIVGPWGPHVNDPTRRRLGERDAGPTSVIALDRIVDTWLAQHTRDASRAVLPNAAYFLPVRNEWHAAEAWPLPSTRFTEFFLTSRGRANSRYGDGLLDATPPANAGFDAFVYDPARPVPSESSRAAISTSARLAGPVDHRSQQERTDVLVYSSPPLEEGLEITGPVSATIYFSTDVPDTDITVRLSDVAPDGRALNLTEGIARARYRTSREAPEKLEPGRVYALTVELYPTSNFFEREHRIRVEVSSSDFPNFGRNLNTGANNETTTKMRIARTRVHHGAETPSSITLPVIPTPLPRWTPPQPATTARSAPAPSRADRAARRASASSAPG